MKPNHRPLHVNDETGDAFAKLIDTNEKLILENQRLRSLVESLQKRIVELEGRKE